MGNFLKVILFVGFIAAVCASISWFMFTFAMETGEHADVGHVWLHDELDLSAEEIEMIEQVEESYADRLDTLEQAFKLKQEALASLLVEQGSYSEDVKQAVREVQRVHGDLQLLSIEHYYDMLKTLPASKHERLKELAAQALSQPE